MKLIGKKKICNFMGKSWPIIEKLILQEGFPAMVVDGFYQADSEQIDAWRRGRPPQAVSSGPSFPEFRKNYNEASTKWIILGGRYHG